MNKAPHDAYWFWCWLCYRAYLALPLPRTHQSLYGRFSLWILGHAGFYAYHPIHSERARAASENSHGR